MPPTVAYLLGRFPVQSEYAVLREIAALRDAGVSAHIFALHAAGDPLPAELVSLEPQVSFLDRARGYGRAACAIMGLLSVVGAPLGACCERSPRIAGARTAAIWRRARLARCLRRLAPDVFHAQFGHLGFLALPIVQRLRIPLVLSFRGQDVRLTRSASEADRARLFGVAALALARCEDMRADLIRSGCPAGKVVVAPSGIDVARIPFRERTPPAPGEPVRIVFVGRRVFKKGADEAERAVNRLKNDYALELRFIHGQPHDAVLAALAEAHLFLLPCRTSPEGEKEGIPNAIKEAMAAGIPVVSTRHAGIPECVAHGESGMLSAEGYTDALAANLRLMLASPRRWAAMGRRGRAIVEERYDIRKLAPQLMDRYREVISPGGRAKT